MACQHNWIVYHRVKGGARFDVCVSGDATWTGDAKIVSSDSGANNGSFTARQLRATCGSAGGASLEVTADRSYLIEIRIAAQSAGSLKICHSVTHNGTKHKKSCCWEIEVEADEKVTRWINLLVP